MINEFQSFLDMLAELLGFSSLKEDGYGNCLIDFSHEKAQILFEYDESLVPQTLLLSTDISIIPTEIYVQILEECLVENFNIAETLSCPPNEKILFIHRRISPNIEKEVLREVINSFLFQIEKWRNKVKDFSQAPPRKLRIPIPASHLQLFPFKS